MDLRRHAGWAMLAIAASAGGVAADDAKASDGEVAAVRALAQVITDGKGHYIAFGADTTRKGKVDPRVHIFYGDGKTFYRVPFVGPNGETSRTRRTIEWKVVDNRYFEQDASRSEIVDDNGAFRVHCQERKTPMTVVSPEETRAMLDAASFENERMDRVPYVIGRDGTTYYYVDRAVRPAGNKDFHVYVGKRGAMKRAAITNMASDDAGNVFSTKAGALRVAVDDTRLAKLAWIPRGKKSIELLSIDIAGAPQLAYSELGVYTGKKFGLPCDDM